MADESWPRGGVTSRKYAAMCLALGMAGGALDAAIRGEDMEGVKHIFDITATATIAKALGYDESDLAIMWDELLSAEEIQSHQRLGIGC
jgi:hypothetical protein